MAEKIRGLHPGLKLSLMLLQTVLIFQVDSLLGLAILIIPLMLLNLSFLTGLSALRLWWFLPLLSWPLTIAVFVLAYASGGAEWASAWNRGSSAGSIYFLRLLSLMLANILFVISTDKQQLAVILEQWHIPEKLRILLLSLFGFLPIFIHEGQRIVEVQRCRGIRLRHLFTRHHLLPLAIPLFVLIMQRSAEMAVAITLRSNLPKAEVETVSGINWQTNDTLAALFSLSVFIAAVFA
jgi:energy-coupling factor transporter transmembrane protein EcfT